MRDCGTCERKHVKMNTSNPMDRISNLPDPMIHLVLSFLETKPVVQTSILSTRWRYIWTSTPFLRFNLSTEGGVFGDFNTVTTLDKKNRKSFMKFVDSVLINRESVNIHKFSLTSELALDRDRLFTWINGALRRNVKIVYLNLSPHRTPFDLPSALFTSNVTELTVTMRAREYGIQLPVSVCTSPRIRSMTLEYLKLPDGNSRGELDFCCPALVHLSMFYCDDGHVRLLTISAPRLKRLGIYNEDFFSEFCKLNICSPNLEYFKFCGCYADISLVNLPDLLRADINIIRPQPDNMDTKMYDACLTKVLKRIYNIDSLLVAVQTLKEIANTPSTLEMLPTIFRNLRDVVVEDTGNITTSESVKAMATILRALPCTQVFVWHRQNEPHISTKDEGLPTQCVLSTLKKFQIEDAHGMEEELAFVEYILKGAICLKELLLTTPKNRKLPTQFCQKLSELSRASSSAVIRYGDVKCSYSSWYESIQE